MCPYIWLFEKEECAGLLLAIIAMGRNTREVEDILWVEVWSAKTKNLRNAGGNGDSGIPCVDI